MMLDGQCSSCGKSGCRVRRTERNGMRCEDCILKYKDNVYTNQILVVKKDYLSYTFDPSADDSSKRLVLTACSCHGESRKLVNTTSVNWNEIAQKLMPMCMVCYKFCGEDLFCAELYFPEQASNLKK
jgi:hypothetical protein